MRTDEEVASILQKKARERLNEIKPEDLKDDDDEIIVDGEPITEDLPPELQPTSEDIPDFDEEETTKKENPNYYANIPAEVRYCDITMGARFMYGEITALCNQKGYCWASNKYFADLYKVSTRTISSWIGELNKEKFIHYEVSENYRRKVYISRYFLGSGKQSS